MVLSLVNPKQAPEKPLLSLKQMVDGPNVKDEANITDRAQRYDFALGEAMTPGVERLAADIRAGNEQYIRENAARQQDFKLNQLYTNQVNELARMGDTQTLQEIMNTPPQRSNPNTVIEENFATQLLADVYFADPDGPQTYEQLSPQRQRLYNQTYDAYNEVVARDEVVRRKYEQYSARWAELGFLTQAWDFIETMIPMKDWLTFSHELNAIPAYNDLRLPGDSLLDQVMYLHTVPLDEFERLFAEGVDAIARVNLNQAFQFIQAVQTYGRTDQAMNNIFFLLDAAGLVGGAVRLGVRGATTGARLATNIRNAGAREALNVGEASVDEVVRPGSPTTFDEVDRLSNTLHGVREANVLGESPSAAAAATGDIGRAVIDEMVDEPISFTTARGSTRGTVRRLMSFMNPSETITGAGRTFAMARDLLARSTTRINRIYDDFTKTQMTIARLTEEQELAAYQEAVDFGRKEFSRFGNVIRNIDRVFAEDTLENVDSVKFTLGKADGSIFSTPQAAGTYATKVIKLPKGSYKIEPVQGGYGISVTRAMDETQDVRQVNVLTENATRNARFGNVSIANELFGNSQNEARKKLVHLTQRSGVLLTRLAKELKLGKGDRKQFTQFLENLRNANILPGVSRGQTTPTTIMDMETAWRGYFGTGPTNAQKRAYFAWIRSHQIEWSLKNLATLRGKQRKGINQVHLSGRGKDKLTTDFEGQVINKDTFSFEDLDSKAGIMIYDSSKTTHEFHTVGDLTPAQKKQILSDLSVSNQAVFRVWNRGEFPMKNLGENKVVDYVISGDYVRSPLKDEQIPFNPNGAILYDNPYQIKQLNTGYNGGRKLLFGERRVAPADSLQEGSEIARHLNAARNLYKQAKATKGSLNNFQNYVNNNLPQIAAKDLADAFEKRTLSLDDEFALMKQEDSILSSNHTKHIKEKAMKDATDLSDDTSQGVSLESSNKPLFDLNIGEVVSPVASIERNLQAAIKSGAVADYVTKAAEQFVKEFADVLKNSSKEIREHPINVLIAPDFVEKGLNADKLKLAKRFHRSVRDLLGYQTSFRRAINAAEDKIYESVYNMPFGNKKIARIAAQFPSMIFEDAPVLLRSLAFNLAMGFWNPYQLFKQVQTITITAALTKNPLHAMQGAGAASLMMALNRSSKSANMIQSMSTVARAAGWDPSEFKELYDLADRSGLSIIRGEHAFKDRWLDPPVTQSGFHKVLHNSTMFFRAAEEFVRLNGLAVAYKEWRKVNPNKAFRRLDQEAVLRRSDDLTANMTHASNAWYNKGFMAFPTQFLSYQLRLMELFWGKRLTKAEKFRLLAYQSAIYGLPAGATVATGILPLPEMLRQNLLAEGVTFDSTGAQALQGGLFGVLSYMITGEETTLAQEYGPGGIDLFMEAIAGDATFLELVMGPSGSKLSQIIESAYPFITGLKRMFGLAPGDGSLNIGFDDVAGLLRNISTFTNIERAIYAINTHSYLRKNGQIALGNDPDGDGQVNDTTGADRFMNSAEVTLLTLFGVDPAVVNDEFLLSMAMQDYDAMQQKPREYIADAITRQFQLALRTDISTEQKQQENARIEQEILAWTAMGNFTVDQINGIIADVARRGNSSTWANMYYEFSTTHTRANPDTLETRRNNLTSNQRPQAQIPAGVLEGILP